MQQYFAHRLNGTDYSDKDVDEFTSSCISPSFTHVQILPTLNDSSFKVEFLFYSYFLSIDPVGPLIDGTLVINGRCVSSSYGPATCIIEYSDGNKTSYNFEEVIRVAPWDMIFSSSEDKDIASRDGNEHATFSIPINIGEFFSSGTYRICILCDEIRYIPFGGGIGEESANIRSDEYLLPSIQFNVEPMDGSKTISKTEVEIDKGTSFNEVGDINEENGIDVITDLKVVVGEEEASRMQDNGYTISLIECDQDFGARYFQDRFRCGSLSNKDGMEKKLGESTFYPDHTKWKFFVCIFRSKYSNTLDEIRRLNVRCLEDVIFLQVEKAGSSIPTVPLYEVYEHDLSPVDSDRSVYIAVRYGPVPTLTSIDLVYQAPLCDLSLREILNLENFKFVQAPDEISTDFGGEGSVVGLRLRHLNHVVPRNAQDSISVTITRPTESIQNEVGDLGELIASVSKFKSEAEALKSANAEIERKIAILLAKISHYSNSSGKIRNDRASEGESSKEGIDPLQVVESNSEKERLYFETIKLIAIGMKKYEKQQDDYRKLTMDLQLRLDDKELKSSEIMASFQDFKKEICQKAVNSRTGLPISKVIAQQFDIAQKKKNEELGRVRLKNIGLRQNIRKLERQLKSREQLAEGLHMIDFEQLKIENQTFNEKIEERNEEYTKLKRKKILTIQVLTHVREKLRFVRKRNSSIQETIEILDTEINIQRGNISNAKKDRDVIKDSNLELKRLHGFAGSELLLRDYEKRNTDIESMKIAIRELQERKRLLEQQVQSNSLKMKESYLMNGQGKGGNMFPPLVKFS